MSLNNPTKAQAQLLAVVDAVLAAGFVADGETASETVRIPTQASPVYGLSGGELRTLGGRLRYAKPGRSERVTVGPRTVNVYRNVDGGVTFLANLQTSTIEPTEFTRDLVAWSNEAVSA